MILFIYINARIPDLIGPIVGIDEKRTPAWRQRLTVYPKAMILSRDEGLSRHHIQHRLVLASTHTDERV